jgi:hypothetical protein
MIIKTREEISDMIYADVKSNFEPSKNWIWVDNFADESGKQHFLYQLHSDTEKPIAEKESFATSDDLEIFIESFSSDIVSALRGNNFLHNAQQMFA